MFPVSANLVGFISNVFDTLYPINSLLYSLYGGYGPVLLYTGSIWKLVVLISTLVMPSFWIAVAVAFITWAFCPMASCAVFACVSTPSCMRTRSGDTVAVAVPVTEVVFCRGGQ